MKKVVVKIMIMIKIIFNKMKIHNQYQGSLINNKNLMEIRIQIKINCDLKVKHKKNKQIKSIQIKFDF